MAPFLPIITSQSRRVAGRNADLSVAGASTLCLTTGAAGEGRLLAGRPLGRQAVFSPPKAWNLKSLPS